MCSVAPAECWEARRIAPIGHSVSVSDLWLVAHHYGVLSTSLGEVLSVESQGVRTKTGELLPCDVIIKCTGFEPSSTAESVTGSKRVHANGVIRENLAYLAEAVWDDASGFSNPFGSSYVKRQ